jgi:hypothetical protein
VILIYPLLAIIAVVLILRTEERRSVGWLGFALWIAVGAVFMFSLLTGFSIGLLLLPAVVVLLYAAIKYAPDFRDSLGFVAGIGVILLVVALINGFSIGWLIAGVGFSSAALGSFVAARQIARRRFGT